MTDFDKDVAAIARIDAVPTILEVVCRATQMRFAAIARVTEDRWVACAVRDDIQFGLAPGGELEVATTICDEIRDSGEPVVIDHVAEDQAFCRHPTPAKYGFQSYISVPIRRPNGEFFGTLCAIDPLPAKVNTPETLGIFRLFAELIGFHLDAQEKLATSEAALMDERRLAELRDQFMAVLGHDLRNPLASIDAGVELLGRMQLDERARKTLALMRSSVRRMVGLIENVLDLARGQLGDGFDFPRKLTSLQPVLEQVLEELRLASPGRTIEAELAMDGPLRCEAARIGQLLSNLVANALAHGASDSAVKVSALTREGMFELSVANQGEPLAADTIERLFQPFFRQSSRKQQGLGLGLYIASEIARAHDGTIDVKSDAEETRFTFRMPVS